MKKLLLLAALGALGGAGWLFYPGDKVRVDIPNGLSASETAGLLRRAGVIRSVRVFKIYAKVTGMDRSLKPGRYLLRQGMPLGSLLRKMRNGDTEQIKIVIPEGFMAKQIADRLEAAGVTSSANFMAYVEKNHLEGFLFPTTYFLTSGLTGEAAAHRMYSEFRKTVSPEFDKAAQTRFTLMQIVTLASIVQREARVLSEMPMIAAVYSNRLRKRMRLEADPTVQYALGRETGTWKKGINFRDLEIVSPYNTYQHFGLPAGPICSPGMDAVRAALHPADSDVLYFVADNTGGHTFNRTFEEHEKAKWKAKKERRRQRK